MIHLENLPAGEAERLAYAEGFTGVAKLYARIDELQRALGEATARMEELEADLRAAQFVNRHERAYGGTE